jgi:hypothetical protein
MTNPETGRTEAREIGRDAGSQQEAAHVIRQVGKHVFMQVIGNERIPAAHVEGANRAPGTPQAESHELKLGGPAFRIRQWNATGDRVSAQSRCDCRRTAADPCFRG